MNIKTGDTVIVIAGKDRGTTGRVTRALPQTMQVLIDGVNVKKKHQKSRQRNQPGQIVERPYPIHVSNVMIVDPKTGTRTRVGKRKENGKLVRVTKKSGSVLT